MAVEFRLLGDVEAVVDGTPVDVGYAQLRCALAVLLVGANRAVSVDQLVDRVWGTRTLPRRPRAAVQHCVTLLRRALCGAPDVAIAWGPGGYRLATDPESVDVHRFAALLQQARSGAGDDPVLYEKALELWRGEPFAGLDTPYLGSVRAALVRQHHAARLDLTDIHLRLGRHAELVPPLAGWAEEYPLDERLAGQYLLALYRSGRQAEALEHYERLRRHLADQLGADPSRALQQVHRQILTADPALGVPERPTLPAAPGPRPVVPRQLPAPPRLFTGRLPELTRLTAALDEPPPDGGAVVICAVGGSGGVGKSWLALHWAHRNADRFPDGQLHANLRGFGPTGEPVPVAVALRGFLDALGVRPGQVPADVDAMAALYRSMIAGRRMLVVLDNARDAAQVIPLLPGSPGCAVLVTSRNRLASLVATHGAHQVNLDVFSDGEARELLTRHLGAHRVTAEPDVADDLLARCAGLPLALGIVAARALAHPEFPLSVLAEEMRAAPARLAALDGGDPATDPRAVLSWSRRALSAGAGRAFDLLGLIPGPDVSEPAVANLLGDPGAGTRAVLHELAGAHLVQQHVPGRYRMHDLVHLYATECARHNQPEDATGDALRRLVDFYLHTAVAGDRLLDPHRRPIDAGEPVTGCRPLPPRDKEAVLAWFTAEHTNLLAAQRSAAEHGWHGRVWTLAGALDTFHNWRGHIHDTLAMWQRGLHAADLLGDPVAQIRAHQGLSHAYSPLGAHCEAVDHLERALALAERTGDLPGQAHTHHHLTWTWGDHGDHERAVEHATHALRLFRTLGQTVWEAIALNTAGWYHAQLGRYAQARTHCAAALDLLHAHPVAVPDAEAATLDSLGYVAHHTGEHEQARGYYRQALAVYRGAGHTYGEANTLDHLGHTHHALGDARQAETCWRQALELYRAQNRTSDADRVRDQMGGLGG